MQQQLQTKKGNVGYKDFEQIKVLGKGTYAKVVLVRKILDGEVYAMKILKKKRIKEKNQTEHLFAEKNILIECDHPFIINLKWSFQNEDKLFFVLDFIQGGELYNLIYKFKRFSEEVCRFYSSQILLAIQYLHQKDIVYRDLKPENVLIDNNGFIKITDFGLSKRNITNQNEAKSLAGTPEYLAPEILTREGHGKPVDYWALGCILYEMYTGDPPFMMQSSASEVGDRMAMFEKIKNQQITLPNQCSPEFQDLLLGLFEKNPEKRLGIDPQKGDIKQHPWFANVDWENLYIKNLKVPWKPKVKGPTDINCFDLGFTEQTVESMQDNSFADQEKVENFTYDPTNMISPQNLSPKENQGLRMEEEYELNQQIEME